MPVITWVGLRPYDAAAETLERAGRGGSAWSGRLGSGGVRSNEQSRAMTHRRATVTGSRRSTAHSNAIPRSDIRPSRTLVSDDVRTSLACADVGTASRPDCVPRCPPLSRETRSARAMTTPPVLGHQMLMASRNTVDAPV